MKRLLIGTLILTTFSSFAKELTEIEAAFLAGLKMGQEKTFSVDSFVPDEGSITVEDKGNNIFDVIVYDGYDCWAKPQVFLKTTANQKSYLVTSEDLDC